MKMKKVKNYRQGILTLHQKQDVSTSISETSESISLCFCFIIGSLWGLYLHKYFFDVVSNKLQTINIYTRVDKKKIKSSRKEYVIRTYFKFWPMKIILRKLYANESLIMGCLQIHRELLSLATFLRVHSKRAIQKELSCLYWQNRYSNLKTTCHIKPKFFFWSKLLESILPAKYLRSVAATLIFEFEFHISYFIWTDLNSLFITFFKKL